jgi:hypothetical protein
MCPSIAFDTSMNASGCRKTSGSPATCQRALNCANVGLYFRDRVFARTAAASFLANHVFDVACFTVPRWACCTKSPHLARCTIVAQGRRLQRGETAEASFRADGGPFFGHGALHQQYEKDKRE